MKYLVLLFVAGTLSSGVYAQTDLKGKTFKIPIIYNQQGALQFSVSSEENKKDVVDKKEIKILAIKEENIFFRYLKDDTVRTISKNLFEELDKTETFKWYKGARVGIYTVPFRLRFAEDDFDFESSLSLSSNIAFGFGAIKNQHSFVDLSVGIGLTSINLTKENSLVIENRSASAFTTSIGVVFKFDEYVNIGFFAGKDFLGKVDRSVNWIYNGNTWLGLGINVNFNEMKTTASRGAK